MGAWVQTAALPAGRYLHTAVLHDRRIYVMGGNTGLVTTSVVTAEIQADGSLSPWEVTTSLPSPRAELTSAIIDERVYVLGGQDFNALDEVLISAFETDGGLGPWVPSTPMPRSRWGHGGAAYGHRLYVMGGGYDSTGSGIQTNETVWATVLVDGGVSPWSQGSSFGQVRVNVSGAAYNGNLLVTGGSYSPTNYRDDSIESAPILADGSLGRWNNLVRFTNGRRHAATLFVADRFFMCCGVGAPGQTHYGDVQIARALGPSAKAQYTTVIDVGADSGLIEAVTINGTLPLGTTVTATLGIGAAGGAFVMLPPATMTSGVPK